LGVGARDDGRGGNGSGGGEAESPGSAFHRDGWDWFHGPQARCNETVTDKGRKSDKCVTVRFAYRSRRTQNVSAASSAAHGRVTTHDASTPSTGFHRACRVVMPMPSSAPTLT